MAGAVVEGFDVVEQDRAELAAGFGFPGIPDVGDFGFEHGPGRFHRGVVEAVAGGAERSVESPGSEPVRELERCVLAAAIGVMDQLAVGVTASDRHH